MRQECLQEQEKHLGTKAAKKQQKGEEYLVIQTVELKCQVNVDRRTKTELQDRRLQSMLEHMLQRKI